ncbi:hypothetical protein BDZ94DRAFT_1275472 [Collybia nuda]|uniref:Uncharacterized protein n=1 Tax=Collybia nuda TaxID=64659 RepID=A0A9P5XRR4_9AGAR|nr:hypothetical protein BDZ94DRAFT_1275472 [Collybia nuda]
MNHGLMRLIREQSKLAAFGFLFLFCSLFCFISLAMSLQSRLRICFYSMMCVVS